MNSTILNPKSSAYSTVLECLIATVVKPDERERILDSLKFIRCERPIDYEVHHTETVDGFVLVVKYANGVDYSFTMKFSEITLDVE